MEVIIMNKKVLMTAFLVAVLSQSVSAVFFRPQVEVPGSFMSKVSGHARSFFANYGKSIGIAAGVTLLYGLYRQAHTRVLTKDFQRLLADVRKAVESQTRYIDAQELAAAADNRNLHEELDSRNYPCVSQETIRKANAYIQEKNRLLRPNMSPQEKLQIKDSVNRALAVFKDRVVHEMPRSFEVRTLEEITAGFKALSDELALTYETLS